MNRFRTGDRVRILDPGPYDLPAGAIGYVGIAPRGPQPALVEVLARPDDKPSRPAGAYFRHQLEPA